MARRLHDADAPRLPADPWRNAMLDPPVLPARDARLRERYELVGVALKVAEALVAGAVGDDGRWMGAAVLAWLRDGGDLVRDHLKLQPERGSHLSPQELARRILHRR